MLTLIECCVVKLDVRESCFGSAAGIWLVESRPRNHSDDKQQWANEHHSSELFLLLTIIYILLQAC